MNTTVLWREEFNQNFDILNNVNLELQTEVVQGDGSTFIPIVDNFPNDIVVGTQLRQENSGGILPTVINAGADGASLRLRLDTYNPTAGIPGDSYLGTAIKTQDTFNLEDGGLAFEASLRLVDSNENPLSRGIIAGFFSYTPIIVDGRRDEIDFEILSNDIDDGQNNNTEPNIFTNVFDNDDFEQSGIFSTIDLGVFPELQGIDLTDFNTFRIEWHPEQILWFINGVEIREELNTIPDRDMSIYLNIWANGFAQAVDTLLLPANSSQSNQTFFYDVDYLQLERITESQQNIIIDIDDFSNTNQITFNGGVTTFGTALRLVSSDNFRGSAFSLTPISIDSDTSFSTSFQVDVNRINGGGDGLTFIVQNDSRRDRALGQDGGNIGYGGNFRIDPSLVIQFDFFQNGIDQDPNNNHVGINLDGNNISEVTASPDFDMDNTDNPFTVWIDYEGESNLIEVFLSETTEKPSTPVLQYEDEELDLSNLLGNEAYIGFSAGQSSGTLTNIDILNWEFSSDFVEPTHVNIYRFQSNERPGTYLFVGEEERQSINTNFANSFVEEGIAFQAAVQPGDDLIGLNRFQNGNVPGTYLYAGEEESQDIRVNFPNFIEEGIAFYVYGSGAGENQFFRFQNSSVPGTYLYATGSEAENIRANFPNFIEEGIAFEAKI